MNRLAFIWGVISLVMICLLWLLISLESLDLFINVSIVSIVLLSLFQIKKNGILSPSTIVFVTALPYFLTAIFNSFIYRDYSYLLERTNASLIFYTFVFFGSFIFFDSYLSKVKIPELNFRKRLSLNTVFLFYSIIVFDNIFY